MSWKKTLGKKIQNIKNIISDSNKVYQEGEFVPPGHFYSAVPSAATRQSYVDAVKQRIETLLDIEINREGQIRLLEELLRFYKSCPFPHDKDAQWRYFYNNPAYSYGDGMTLQAILRHFTPNRVIEIGSGYSSAAMLDINEHFLDRKINFTFIEPHPKLLHSLLKEEDTKSCKIIATGAQEVELSLFSELKENDILFIDSTHVSKLGSDVNSIFFNILPRLNSGVIIHFHDIFWPFEYPASWIQDGRAWNEIYILRAMLQHNKDYSILFFSDYLRNTYFDWFSENVPLFLRNSGGNLWMKKCTCAKTP